MDNIGEKTIDKAYETSDKKPEPCLCTFEENGDVNCVTPEENFEKIKQKGIKPKRLVLEVEEEEEDEEDED